MITDQHRLLSPSQFCFESVNIGEDIEKWITAPFICVPLPPPNKNVVFLLIYATGDGCKQKTITVSFAEFFLGLSISCLSLALICVIYGYFLKNPLPHRKFVTCYALCLLGSYVLVGVAQVIHPTASMCDLLGNTES